MTNVSDVHRSLQPFVFRPGEVTTAWEVLERLKALAKDDPRRINMQGFLWTQAETPGAPFDWPECGTVGCLSGWTSVLLRHEKHNHVAVDWALGVTKVDKSLFYPSWYGSSKQCDRRTVGQVIDHITQFQARHEQALRGQRIEVGR